MAGSRESSALTLGRMSLTIPVRRGGRLSQALPRLPEGKMRPRRDARLKLDGFSPLYTSLCFGNH